VRHTSPIRCRRSQSKSGGEKITSKRKNSNARKTRENHIKQTHYENIENGYYIGKLGKEFESRSSDGVKPKGQRKGEKTVGISIISLGRNTYAEEGERVRGGVKGERSR